MARLFTIDVPFQDKHYTALVSVVEKNHDLHCTVRYIDKALKYILPEDQLIFSLQEGLKQPKDLPGDLAQSLIVCTSEAISRHFSHTV